MNKLFTAILLGSLLAIPAAAQMDQQAPANPFVRRPDCSRVRFNPSAADSTSFPTIMQVRDATVGPLFGTPAVSGRASSTAE